MIAPDVARRIAELRTMAAEIEVIAEADDGSVLLHVTPHDGLPAFTLLCESDQYAGTMH